MLVLYLFYWWFCVFCEFFLGFEIWICGMVLGGGMFCWWEWVFLVWGFYCCVCFKGVFVWWFLDFYEVGYVFFLNWGLMFLNGFFLYLLRLYIWKNFWFWKLLVYCCRLCELGFGIFFNFLILNCDFFFLFWGLRRCCFSLYFWIEVWILDVF